MVGTLLVLFVIANSSFACSVAGQNASTRVYYSLGRAGVFPKWLNHINPKTETPDRAIFLQAGLSLFFALAVGFIFGAMNGYGLLGLLFTIALMIVYIMTNVSCFALFFFKYRDEFNPWMHLVIPIAGTIAMLAPLAAALVPDLVFGPDNANTYPATLGLPITVAWFVIGLIVYLWLRVRRPQELDLMANEMATAELVGEDPRERVHAGLRYPVGRRAAAHVRQLAHPAGEVHDSPMTRAAQQRRAGGRQPPGPEQVDVEHLLRLVEVVHPQGGLEGGHEGLLDPF